MATIGIIRCRLSCGCSIMVVDDGEVPTDPIRWCSLHAAAPALLEAVRETREAAAACFRAFVIMDGDLPNEKGQVILADEMQRAGVRNGFGLRADIAINAAIGNVEEWKRLKTVEAERARKEKNVQ